MSRKERSVISKSSGEINKFKKKKCSIIPQGIKKKFSSMRNLKKVWKWPADLHLAIEKFTSDTRSWFSIYITDIF